MQVVCQLRLLCPVQEYSFLAAISQLEITIKHQKCQLFLVTIGGIKLD